MDGSTIHVDIEIVPLRENFKANENCMYDLLFLSNICGKLWYVIDLL